MAGLARCWLLIETTIIPDGFLKWFYLSFYIHPFFLVLCQIFLWLRLILKCILLIFFYPYKLISYVCLYVFKLFKKCVIYVFSSFIGLTNTTSEEATDKVHESFEPVKICNRNQSFTSCSTYSSITPSLGQLKVLQFQEYFQLEEKNYELKDDKVSSQIEEKNLHLDEDKSMIDEDDDDDLFSTCSSCGGSSSDSCKDDSSVESTKDASLNEYIQPLDSPDEADIPDNISDYPSMVFSSVSPILPQDQESNDYSTCFNSLQHLVEPQEIKKGGFVEDTDSDEFYNKYTERMRWFDVLNYERTCGTSSVLNNQIGSPSSVESDTETVDSLGFPYTLWGRRTAKKKLLKSLESDFEVVYVAQSCLSWEALHYQYRKVEALASATSQTGVFYHNVAGEFQKFHVLLDRFMEDERSEGKRIWNYARGRFALKSLLQVPKISGFVEKEMEEMKVEAINVKEVLKGIERCLEAFWEFVKTDDKRPWWKFRSSLWTCPPVEDPRDLDLLADITRQLQKKELWLKDSQGKQRCWFRKVVNAVEYSQRKELMFTMIDIKLVSRVLQLPLLSTSQLKWCQEKLDSIEFEEGKIVRTRTRGPLFPP